VLGQLSTWVKQLHDLGETEVKHGVRVHVFNVYTDEHGNAEMPEKLRRQREQTQQPTQPTQRAQQAQQTPTVPAVAPHEQREPLGVSVTGAVEADAKGLRVALLYKRNAQPDEHVLKLLERELQAHDYNVFIDRHLSIGVEWAKEIERQVRTADAVVPIISQASAQSEMLAYEV